MQHHKLAAAAFALAMAGSTVAFAGTDADRAPTAVKIEAAVNFQNPAEVKGFYRRIERAALDACVSQVPSVEARRADDACISKAVADAVATANKPTLTALYQSSHDVGYAGGY